MTCYRKLTNTAAFSIICVAFGPAFAPLVGCTGLTTPPSPEPIASETVVASAAPSASAPKIAQTAPTQPPPPPPPQPAPPVPNDVKAPPASAKKTASGLAYRLLKPGGGKDSPKATDRVTVNYSGWTTDGKMFDSSVTRGQPATFPLNGVIKGWTEGLQLMKVGDKMRFWIPGDLAYGDKPQRPGAPAGTLVFDVDLLGINQPSPMPGHP